MNNNQLDDVSRTNEGENIEAKTYRLTNQAWGGVIESFENALIDVSFQNTCKAISLAIAEERVACGWVSVNDRLPVCEFEHEELGVNVSQTVNIYGVSDGDYHGQGFGELHSDGRWVCYGGEHDFMNIKEVTHWSSLAAAPKDEVSDNQDGLTPSCPMHGSAVEVAE